MGKHHLHSRGKRNIAVVIIETSYSKRQNVWSELSQKGTKLLVLSRVQRCVKCFYQVEDYEELQVFTLHL
jgi:hypothetical protein